MLLQRVVKLFSKLRNNQLRKNNWADTVRKISHSSITVTVPVKKDRDRSVNIITKVVITITAKADIKDVITKAADIIVRADITTAKADIKDAITKAADIIVKAATTIIVKAVSTEADLTTEDRNKADLTEADLITDAQ